MVAPLANWPWQKLGSYKYSIYGVFIGHLIHVWWKGNMYTMMSTWCFHVLILCALRCFIHQLFHTYSSMYFLSQNRRINHHAPDFKQIDHESHWDNYVILQAMVGSLVCYMFYPRLIKFENVWDTKGFIGAMLLHMLVSEPLYYYIHRYFHMQPYFYNSYHYFHHSSPVLHPYTAENTTFLEQILLIPIIGIPLVGAAAIGHASISLVYVYVLLFDFLKCLGHSNVEIIPHRLFQLLPIFKYLLYTPTYHSLHHWKKDCNFCLFMPIYDLLGNTLNDKSWKLHKQINSNKGMSSSLLSFLHLNYTLFPKYLCLFLF